MFSLLGDSDLVGRLVPALLGTLLVPLLYPIYKLGYLDKKQTLAAALFLAVSPNMVYFSRFLRNDIFIVFFTMVLLVALLYYFERHQMRYALIAGAAIGFGMSTKENMPIIIAIFGLYLIYLIWTRKVQLPTRWIRDAALGGLVMVGIMAVFYSSFGAHPEMLTDWWLLAIKHWLSMHEAQRLGGPPYFYILLFLLYEVPILILAVIGTLQFIGTPGIVSRWREKRMRPVETPGAEAVDETPSEEAADATPGAETADATPGEEAADATPGEEAVDETPGEEAADATPGAETADETPGAEAVDETPEAAAPPIEKTRGWKDRLRGSSRAAKEPCRSIGRGVCTVRHLLDASLACSLCLYRREGAVADPPPAPADDLRRGLCDDHEESGRRRRGKHLTGRDDVPCGVHPGGYQRAHRAGAELRGPAGSLRDD
jgi:hypothetical protein